MKKLLSLVSAFVVIISALVLPAYAENELFSKETLEYYKNLGLQGTVLNVYNWGEYIDDEEVDVITEFERLTGCDVNYTTFESNENMYSKLSGGGVSYDIIIPSDYMVERLISEDMLLPLDYNNIPNYDKYFCVFAQYDVDADANKETLTALSTAFNVDNCENYVIYYTGEYDNLTFNCVRESKFNKDAIEDLFVAEGTELACYNHYTISVPVTANGEVGAKIVSAKIV